MTDGQISVKFTADVSGLQAQLALAQARLRALSGELKATADAAVYMGSAISGSASARLADLNGQVDRAKSSIVTMQQSLKAAADGAEATGGSLRHAGAGAGFYMRELHAMMDEASSGRFKQLEGTMVNVALQRAARRGRVYGGKTGPDGHGRGGARNRGGARVHGL